MRRISLPLTLAIIGSAGCQDAAKGPAAGKPIRSEQATGVWDQSQVETYLKQNLKLADVSLTRAGGDNYAGTGRTSGGKTLRLAVKQVKGGIACKYEDDAGGSG